MSVVLPCSICGRASVGSVAGHPVCQPCASTLDFEVIEQSPEGFMLRVTHPGGEWIARVWDTEVAAIAEPLIDVAASILAARQRGVR
jgi:hypothetical protein